MTQPSDARASGAGLPASVAAVLTARIDDVQFQADVQRYTDFRSRHIRHRGNDDAVDRLEVELKTIGTTVVRRAFSCDGIRCENIEATLAGNGLPNAVLVTAHLDSTASGEPGYQPAVDDAPGADDNASGIAGVLAAARALAQLAADNPATPRREVRFVLFDAEEEGQAGSQHYAVEHSTGVEGVFNMDMIACNVTSAVFELHAGYSPECPPAGSPVETLSLPLAELVRDVALVVSPGLRAEIHPLLPGQKEDLAQFFGDHTSFHVCGIPACLISEDFVGTKTHPHARDPNREYHLREDSIADNRGLNWAYGAGIARAVAGAAWSFATR